MKILITLIWVAFFSTISHGQTINCQWVDFSTGNRSYCSSVDIDNDDNIFTTGSFYNLTIGDYDLLVDETPPEFNAFILKHDSDGNIQWLNRIESVGYCNGSDIRCDYQNNLIMGGVFENSITVSGQTLISDGYSNVFIIKMNNDGELIWSRQVKNANGLSIQSLEVDDSGSIYVYIRAPGGLTQFDNLSTDANHAVHIVAKYDPEGNIKWIKETFSASNITYINAKPLAVSNTGNIYYTGSFKDTITFNNTTIIPRSDWYQDDIVQPDSIFIPTEDYFLAKIDSNGNEKWIKTIGNNGKEAGYSIAANDESIFVAGRFTDTLSLDSDLYLTGGGKFLLKYDTLGTLLNYKYIENGYIINQIKASANYLYVTGVKGFDIFLDKYDLELNLIQSLSTGGSNSGYGNTISLSQNDFIALGGVFYTEAQFGDFLIENENDVHNFYLAKLGTDLVPTFSISNDIEYSIYPNPISNILYGNTTFINSRIMLRIFNTSGQLLSNELLDTDSVGKFRTSLAFLDTGLYFIEIEFEGSRITKKVYKN